MRATALLLLATIACSGTTREPANIVDGGATRDAGPTRDGGAYVDPCGCASGFACEAGACVPKDAVLLQFFALTTVAVGEQQAVVANSLRVVTSSSSEQRPALAEGGGCVVYGQGRAANTHDLGCIDHGTLQIDLGGDVRNVAYQCDAMTPGLFFVMGMPLVDVGTRIDVHALGGADVGPFDAYGFMPENITVQLPPTFVPGEPVTVTWPPGDGLGTITLSVGAGDVFADCEVADDGEHVIPGNVTALMPMNALRVMADRIVVTDTQLVDDVLVTVAKRQSYNNF